jgi:bla regulator protein blaR1
MLVRGLDLRGLLLVGVLGVACGLPLRGQVLHASGPLPSFEVVSIKPMKMMGGPPPPLMPGGGPGGEQVISQIQIRGGMPTGAPRVASDRMHMVMPARMLIAAAYNLPMLSAKSQMEGGPEWVDTNRYEIDAKIEEAMNAAMQKMPAAERQQQVELMEQSLLAERFKLQVHFETRELPEYALVVAKGGPKMKAAAEGEAKQFSVMGTGQGSEMKATAQTVGDLARMLQMQPEMSGRLVVDQTGLAGAYDFAMKWTREQGADAEGAGSVGGDAPTYFTALQEQLGLKLVPTKGMVEVVVIDHIELPSEN